MGPEILIPIGFFATVTTIVLAVLRHRERMRGIAPDRALPSRDPELLARLERLEQGIEAMAIELERMSEGQRFVTRLLVERHEAPPALAAGTPPGAA